MPRRKKETANGADQDVTLKRSRTQPNPGPAAEPADAEEDDQPAAAPSRLQGMADVARRRAAHFAHFRADEDDEAKADNIHAGGDQARKLGPWSSAVELAEGRAAAAAARQDKILDAAHAAAQLTEEIAWKPQRDPVLGDRPALRVPPLFQMCLSLLTEHIEDVDSLLGLPDAVKVALAASVAARRKLDSEAVKLFAEGWPDELVLPNCTALEQADVIQALQKAASPSLDRLELDLCGRGFSDYAASVIAGRTPGLKTLKLGGAYRLTDVALSGIVDKAPLLESLALPQCSRLQGAALLRLPATCPQLRSLDLTDCRGIGADALRAALCGGEGPSRLEMLSLDSIGEVDDNLVTEIALASPALRDISLRFCRSVTDVGLQGLAAGSPKLEALRADEVGKITDTGLAALAEACPGLQRVSLRSCFRVTDIGLVAVASRGELRHLDVSNVPNVGMPTVKALIAHCGDKLEVADLSWCRGIPGAGLGLLADSCPNLRCLTVFGCSQAGKNFYHGHSNPDLKIHGATEQRSAPPSVAKIALICEED